MVDVRIKNEIKSTKADRGSRESCESVKAVQFYSGYHDVCINLRSE